MVHTNHIGTGTGTGTGTGVDPAWAPWNRAWTRQLRVLTGRDDLTVLVAPGAAGPADARYLPAQRRVEIDAVHIGTPDITDPTRPRHKNVVPTAYGLLVHEAAHAAHSHWNIPAGTPPVVADAAMLLEESRAENRQRGRRRGDRRWLRHTATTLLITPDDTPIDDLWHAGRLAGLLLARVDARIITARDVRPARAGIQRILGRQRLTTLRHLWQQAHTCHDHDTTTMINLGWRWCHTLNIDPHQQPDPPTPDPGQFPGDLAAAITTILATTHTRTTRQQALHHATTTHPAPATWTRRDPTPAEQHAARQLAHRIRQARTTPETTTRASAVPPGRLRTRHAITAQAQTAAGTVPTATPWQQRTHQPPPTPTLHLAVLVDVSGSMDPYRQPMSSASWILAHAADGINATTTSIAFGTTTTLLHAPGQHTHHVLDMDTDGATTAFPQAVKLADTLLHLRQPGPLRILTVVSDGDLEDPHSAQQLLTTLHRHGCAILWLQPKGPYRHTFTHTTTLTIDNPVHAITTIADAALHALTTHY